MHCAKAALAGWQELEWAWVGDSPEATLVGPLEQEQSLAGGSPWVCHVEATLAGWLELGWVWTRGSSGGDSNNGTCQCPLHQREFLQFSASLAEALRLVNGFLFHII